MPLCVYELMSTDDPRLIPLMQGGKKLDIRVKGNNALINGKSLKFSELVERSDYYSMNRFVFNSVDLFVEDKTFSIINACFNVLPWTAQSSLKVTELTAILHGNYILHIITYPETKDFESAFWLVHVPTIDQLTTNMKIDFLRKPEYLPTQGFTEKLYAPKPIINGPEKISAKKTVTLDFEYRNWNNEFKACDFPTYIKTNAGYLPKNIVEVKDGKAKIKVTALGLEKGDVINLKFSIGKFYTNAVNHTLTVI